MDEETWELLTNSFNKKVFNSDKKPSYLIILDGKEYDLTYEEESGYFPEEIIIHDKQSGCLIGSMNEKSFTGLSSLDVEHYTENDNLTRIIDRMKYYNNKREEERKAEIERREKKLNGFLYGDG